MKLAIMQPYIFPYIGYFQLINSVDKFVILDDVNFINRGWINRNKILVNNSDYLFTIPLKEVSQNKKISDILISEDIKWQPKFLKTLLLAYKKAPYFEETFKKIENILQDNENNISTFIFNSLKKLNVYLGIETEIIETSRKYKNSQLKGQDKIIDICLKEKANQYINPIGGTEIYSRHCFEEKNIKLKFLKTNNIFYKQNNNSFIPWLSIIDVMMFNSKENISKFLREFTLV